MIPASGAFLERDFKIEKRPSKTYKMILKTQESIRGYAEQLEAMQQAIYKILNTERYQYVMYSWNYGIETLDLYGEPVNWVCPELETRIQDALMVDDRILKVSDFEHDTTQKHVIHTTFTVQTIFGDVRAEKEVTI